MLISLNSLAQSADDSMKMLNLILTTLHSSVSDAQVLDSTLLYTCLQAINSILSAGDQVLYMSNLSC